MNDVSARERVHHAKIELEAAERALDSHWQPWHERLRRHRVALLIGGGLLSGLAFATVPSKRLARIGASLFAGSARLVRSPLMPAFLGALLTSVRRSNKASGASATDKSNSAQDKIFLHS
jgi:hypothetical protein